MFFIKVQGQEIEYLQMETFALARDVNPGAIVSAKKIFTYKLLELLSQGKTEIIKPQLQHFI